MPRIVETSTDSKGLWYRVTCERCHSGLGYLSARMWSRREAELFACYVCEPNRCGDSDRYLEYDDRPNVAMAASEDEPLHAVDPMYQAEADQRVRERIAALQPKGDR